MGELEHAIAAADDVEGSVDETFVDLGRPRVASESEDRTERERNTIMDWTDRLKDWAEDAGDRGGDDDIFDKVGDFLGEQVDCIWAQDLVDAGADGVIDKLDGTVSQPVDGVLPTSSGPLNANTSTVRADDLLPDGVERRRPSRSAVVSFEADPAPSHFDEAVAAGDAVDDSVYDTFVDLG